MRRKFDLQLFAAGDNNNQAIRYYGKQFAGIVEAVFAVQSHFGDFFAGGLETLDGISEKATAFSVKTSDVASALTAGTVSSAGAYTNGYNTGANVGMGTGTGSTSRFGNRAEVIYNDIDVPYSFNWTFHEGLDRHTVNNDFDAAIADRLDLQAQAKVAMINAQHGAYISSIAEKVISKSAITASNVGDVFNELSAYFVNIGAVGTKVANVSADVYNAIIDSGLATTAKGSTVNIDRETVEMFKGFVIEQIPAGDFAETTVVGEESNAEYDDCIYAYVQHIGKAFLGINTARTIESEDFDGVALQGAGKGGQWVPNDNKAAVAKVYTTGA